MSNPDHEAEDVAGLFRKFGGDAKGYKEFEPAPEPAQGPSRAAWPLIPGSRQGAPAPAATPAPAPATPATPVPAALAPISPAPVAAVPAMPASRPEPTVPPPIAAPASAAGTPRELDLLFARLSGQPQPAPEGGHGLMSRWRKPS